MKIKRIRRLKVNSTTFSVKWNKTYDGAYFNYSKHELEIGVEDNSDDEVFETICHEIMEICCCEMRVRHRRSDCDSDYIFVYDHRQHTTIMGMFAGLVSQFIAVETNTNTIKEQDNG